MTTMTVMLRGDILNAEVGMRSAELGKVVGCQLLVASFLVRVLLSLFEKVPVFDRAL